MVFYYDFLLVFVFLFRGEDMKGEQIVGIRVGLSGW